MPFTRKCGCGSPLREEARFCDQCGKPVERAHICSCGVEISAGTRFCFNCGIPVAPEAQGVVAAVDARNWQHSRKIGMREIDEIENWLRARRYYIDGGEYGQLDILNKCFLSEKISDETLQDGLTGKTVLAEEVAIAPQLVERIVGIARGWAEEGLHPGASTLLVALSALAPDARLLNLAGEYQWLLEKVPGAGERGRALTLFERALSLDPKDLKAQLNRAVVLLETADNEAEMIRLSGLTGADEEQQTAIKAQRLLDERRAHLDMLMKAFGRA